MRCEKIAFGGAEYSFNQFSLIAVHIAYHFAFQVHCIDIF
jgi:hypothetical protein